MALEWCTRIVFDRQRFAAQATQLPVPMHEPRGLEVDDTCHVRLLKPFNIVLLL